MYQEWHMFASQSDHSSWFTKERREQTANVHNKGGNFIFSDGHAEYRKHWDRASGDYGLVHPVTKKSLPFEPTRASTTTTLDAAFIKAFDLEGISKETFPPSKKLPHLIYGGLCETIK
jgi:prepilin-type processing-associated H-X9-DG protein